MTSSAPRLLELIASWQRAIDAVLAEQSGLIERNAGGDSEYAARLGHRLDAYSRCVRELSALVREKEPPPQQFEATLSEFQADVKAALEYVAHIVVESDGYPSMMTAADLRTLLVNAVLEGMEMEWKRAALVRETPQQEPPAPYSYMKQGGKLLQPCSAFAPIALAGAWTSDLCVRCYWKKHEHVALTPPPPSQPQEPSK